MIREFIDKLMLKKQELKKYKTNNNVVDTKISDDEIDIRISKQGNVFKIEISNYISIADYIKKVECSDEYKILDLISNSVLWNNKKQCVNKGVYYIINTSNCLYNILFTDEMIKIDERNKIELDEQTQKKNIIQERVVTININKEEYHYFTAKHEENGNTYYTKYYNKNIVYGFEVLELSKQKTYEEVEAMFYNLEAINGIENILDIEILKEYILKDLSESLIQRRKIL